MEIYVAKSAGFCFGVDRAVKTVNELLKEHEKVCTLGEIIHNPQIVAGFAENGVRVIESVSQALPGETVVIRSHGVAKSVTDELDSSGQRYCDATCPYVAKIHRIVGAYTGEDEKILIAGDSNHPEIIGISGHCKTDNLIFKDELELEEKLKNNQNIGKTHYILVAQTTFNINTWRKCVKTAKKLCTNLLVFDTICKATSESQSEAEKLAEMVDLMIVVGGKNSSNTSKLHELCEKKCRTVLVETARELEGINLCGVQKIGITAGASTPACIIKEVHSAMSEKMLNNTEEENFKFEEALEQSFSKQRTYAGQKVKGIVTSIAANEIQVDIGSKHAGFVSLSELTEDGSAKVEDIVKKGDEIELIVLKVNDQEGTVALSKKRLDAIAGYEAIEKAAEDGTVLSGIVTEVVKGGVIVLTNGVRIFVPASQATARKDDSLDALLKKQVSLKILEFNAARRRAVGSIRAVANEQRKAASEKFWSEVAVGKTYKGEVKSITSYGAFVDLGGVDGMVHISELSWKKIKNPSEVVKIGDIIEVYVKDIDAENKKISLGYKKTEDNPWEIVKSKFSVDDVCKAKIVSVTSFGAFAEIYPGIDGLIHISQISHKRINKPSDALSIGQEVEVKITEIDFDKKRISLSIKALTEKPEESEAASEQ